MAQELQVSENTPPDSQIKEGQTAVYIHNTTGLRKPVYDTAGIFGFVGARIDLAPHEVRPVKKEIARLFFEQWPAEVIEYVPVPLPEIPGEPKIWMANMTGSPFYKPTVKLSRVVKGQTEIYEVDNPLCKEQSLRYVDGGNQVEKDLGDAGKVWWPAPTNIFVFPPYTRYPISQTYSRWLASRDDRQEEQHRGKLKICRAPTSFEPNDSWPLTYLQAYAKALGSEQLLDREDLMGKPVWQYYGRDYEIEEARLKLYRALWFVLIDPAVLPLPEEGFRHYLKLREKEDAEAKIKHEHDERRERLAESALRKAEAKLAKEAAEEISTEEEKAEAKRKAQEEAAELAARKRK